MEFEEGQPATILERRRVKGRCGNWFQHPLEEHFAVFQHPLDFVIWCSVGLLGCSGACSPFALYSFSAFLLSLVFLHPLPSDVSYPQMFSLVVLAWLDVVVVLHSVLVRGFDVVLM
jgi:hypothetical protein